MKVTPYASQITFPPTFHLNILGMKLGSGEQANGKPI